MEIEHIADKCTGCNACYSICPHGAINMCPDAWGYIRPKIDHEKCVECGLCDRACPEIHPVDRNINLKVLAAIAHVGDSAGCSSGGAASSIAAHIIASGGVVYGCTQTEGDGIVHRRLTESGELTAMKGSKYVQSDIGPTFRQCRGDLREGRKVVYIGTPCQIAGLKKFLGKDYHGLITVDLVCHGVPSQQLLSNELQYLHGTRSLPPTPKVEFRDKSSGKVKFGFYLYDGDRKILSRNYPRNYYISGFMSGLFFRPNCFSCPYAGKDRTGDITLGDFWGLGKERPSAMKASEGVSLVMVNSTKGLELMEAVSDRLKIEKRSLDEAVKGNTQLRHPFKRPERYDEFQSLYISEGYEAACRKCLGKYIHENTRYMQIEEHPWLMLPYRVWLKLKNLILTR